MNRPQGKTRAECDTERRSAVRQWAIAVAVRLQQQRSRVQRRRSFRRQWGGDSVSTIYCVHLQTRRGVGITLQTAAAIIDSGVSAKPGICFWGEFQRRPMTIRNFARGLPGQGKWAINRAGWRSRRGRQEGGSEKGEEREGL
ncbi:hypothetical protein DFH27DRAFT_649481 [Peziza echinospora]|nr:hypothetical protein DFH27DRAFT_649481 [Peziza echinospora]